MIHRFLHSLIFQFMIINFIVSTPVPPDHLLMPFLSFRDAVALEKIVSGTVQKSLLLHDGSHDVMEAVDYIIQHLDPIDRPDAFKELIKNNSLDKVALLQELLKITYNDLDLYDHILKQLDSDQITDSLSVAVANKNAPLVKHILDKYNPINNNFGALLLLVKDDSLASELEIFKLLAVKYLVHGQGENAWLTNVIGMNDRIEMMKFLYENRYMGRPNAAVVELAAAYASLDMAKYLLSITDFNQMEDNRNAALRGAVVRNRFIILDWLLIDKTFETEVIIRGLELAAWSQSWDCFKVILISYSGNLRIYSEAFRFASIYLNLEALEFIHSRLDGGIMSFGDEWLWDTVDIALAYDSPSFAYFLTTSIPELDCVDFAAKAVENNAISTLKAMVGDNKEVSAGVLEYCIENDMEDGGYESLEYLVTLIGNENPKLIEKLFSWATFSPSDQTRLMNFLKEKYSFSEYFFQDNLRNFIDNDIVIHSHDILAMLPDSQESAKRVIENLKGWIYLLNGNELNQIIDKNLLSDKTRDGMVKMILKVNQAEIVGIYSLLTKREKFQVFSNVIKVSTQSKELIDLILEFGDSRGLLTKSKVHQLLKCSINRLHAQKRNLAVFETYEDKSILRIMVRILYKIIHYAMRSGTLSEKDILLIWPIEDLQNDKDLYLEMLNYAYSKSMLNPAMFNELITSKLVLKSSDFQTSILHFCESKNLIISIDILKKLLKMEPVIKDPFRVQAIIRLSKYHPKLLEIAAELGIIFVFNEFIRAGKKFHSKLKEIAFLHGQSHILELLMKDAKRNNRATIDSSHSSKKQRLV